MVSISVEYTGDLHCRSIHGPSGAELDTDAPVDNHGRGESFSPTDLVATALASCMATTMAIKAQQKDLELKGMKISVEKHMSADAPRRIARLPVKIEMPLPEDHPQRALLEATALGCPVHRSLHPEVEKPIEWAWVG